MSEEILKVFLSDLDTVRVVCGYCKTTIEIKISELRTRMKVSKCPLCPQPFALPDRDDEFPADYNVFAALEQAFRYLNKIDDKASIEFPVKIEPAAVVDSPKRGKAKP